MDSLTKAFQKGLAKAVAAGQQQLHQRLSKYDEQNASANAAAADAYGTDTGASSHYAHGNQGPHQTPTAAGQQQVYHSTYLTPAPGTYRGSHHHAQPSRPSVGQGLYTSAASDPAPGTPASPAGYHGRSQHHHPPPLPPRTRQQPPTHDSRLPNHNQNTWYGAQSPDREAPSSAATSTQPAHGTLHQQTAHINPAPPVSSPTTYPPGPPPRANPQQQGNNHCPQADYSLATSRETAEHPEQYRPVAETTASHTAVQTSQNPHAEALQNPHPYNAPTTTTITQHSSPESREASPMAPARSHQPVVAQQSAPPASNTSHNGYTGDHAQARHAVVPEHHQPPQNHAESMAQQMNNLSMSNRPAGSADNNTLGWSVQTPRHVHPPIVASGTPRDTVQHCPEDRVVEYSLYWYQLPENPNFLICTKCHEDHIQGTSLAGQFKRILAEEASSSSCRFWYPRVRDILWKQALAQNSLDGLRTYATRRLAIPNCNGKEATVGKDGVRYYGMRNNDIKGFITCEACYEDKIIGTAFESAFTPCSGQGAEDKWFCDTHWPYLNRALATFAGMNDWSGFVERAAYRLQLPACEGDSKPASEGPWYLFRRKLDNFYVCATCYMDKLELTAFEGEFEAVNQNVGFDAWMEMLGQRWTCGLAKSSLPVLVALETAINDKDFDGFWKSAQAISKLVPCTGKGIIRGNWWTLIGGCRDFDICEACYVGVFTTKGLDKFLEPAADRDPETTVVCNFCPASPRFKQFAQKYLEALDRGVFSYYADCVRKFASVPPCPGIHHSEKAKWWGYPEALFCEDCYVGFVADTRLAPHIPIKGEVDQRAQICQVWSPRMRGMWMEACAAGEPGSSASNEQVERFRAFGDKRLQVYLQTVPRIKFIQQMREMRMMNAMHQGQLSLMYSGMNSMAVLSGTADGNLHGNSSLGWYETEHGATGAQMFNDMQSGFASANRTDDWMEIMRLQALWSEVE
ncbi:uncharacterized protein MAM_05662 [Metarhizium album ARSEF 1941]|uniref:Integral membrane protein n=1 Tax=Metarhizium album (strain ARSEF 1941) TaxID=1081103 RepID=A0A0B2WQT5_METAS|nr:uncharacterized protein MAM_05662 [Metarhizium album ARSEF 1941]KHN96373.1 integral membrane protein [Metarhizium album ARSEF 1941]